MPEAWECLFDSSDLPSPPINFLKKIYFVFIYMYLCALCVDTQGGQKRAAGPMELQ